MVRTATSNPNEGSRKTDDKDVARQLTKQVFEEMKTEIKSYNLAVKMEEYKDASEKYWTKCNKDFPNFKSSTLPSAVVAADVMAFTTSMYVLSLQSADRSKTHVDEYSGLTVLQTIAESVDAKTHIWAELAKHYQKIVETKQESSKHGKQWKTIVCCMPYLVEVEKKSTTNKAYKISNESRVVSNFLKASGKSKKLDFGCANITDSLFKGMMPVIKYSVEAAVVYLENLVAGDEFNEIKRAVGYEGMSGTTYAGPSKGVQFIVAFYLVRCHGCLEAYEYWKNLALLQGKKEHPITKIVKTISVVALVDQLLIIPMLQSMVPTSIYTTPKPARKNNKTETIPADAGSATKALQIAESDAVTGKPATPLKGSERWSTKHNPASSEVALFSGHSDDYKTFNLEPQMKTHTEGNIPYHVGSNLMIDGKRIGLGWTVITNGDETQHVFRFTSGAKNGWELFLNTSKVLQDFKAEIIDFKDFQIGSDRIVTDKKNTLAASGASLAKVYQMHDDYLKKVGHPTIVGVDMTRQEYIEMSKKLRQEGSLKEENINILKRGYKRKNDDDEEHEGDEPDDVDEEEEEDEDKDNNPKSNEAGGDHLAGKNGRNAGEEKQTSNAAGEHNTSEEDESNGVEKSTGEKDIKNVEGEKPAEASDEEQQNDEKVSQKDDAESDSEESDFSLGILQFAPDPAVSEEVSEIAQSKTVKSELKKKASKSNSKRQKTN